MLYNTRPAPYINAGNPKCEIVHPIKAESK